MKLASKLLGGSFAFMLISTAALPVMSFAAKREFDVPTEKAIERRKVVIKQSLGRSSPVLDRADSEVERARRVRLDQKTQELITQLENLYRREGQAGRKGEILMRLAELYYERGEIVASMESMKWEDDVKRWEALNDSQRAKTPRPELKTPRADTFRKKAVDVYESLERMSRGSDRGADSMIRRDEVLFFYGATLVELNQSKKAVPMLEELVAKYPKSRRNTAARLTLADFYFETNQFKKALGHYLRIAASPGSQNGQDNIQAYAFYKLGWCYINTVDYDKAILSFKKTLQASKASKSERRVAFEKEALNDIGRAFVLAGEFEAGEDFFSGLGSDNREKLSRFRALAAEGARDQGKLELAMKFYDKLIEENPEGPAALDYSLEKARLYLRAGQMNAYVRQMDKNMENFGAESSWLRKNGGNEENRKMTVSDLVSQLRREAKERHNIAQKRKKKDVFVAAKPFYQLYFKHVPSPNFDTAENVHEMKFFYAELLYRIEDYRAASVAYQDVGEGKYAAASAYSRILSLKELAKNDKDASRELLAASEEFTKKYPQDERSGDILYTSAAQAFESGASKDSLETLEALVQKFPDKQRGVDSAERIIFILEKDKDFDGAEAKAKSYLANDRLLKTGGPEFRTRMQEIVDRSAFKKVENMPEGGSAELSIKAKAYLNLADDFKGELREKALNNAAILADKGKDAATAKKARLVLLKEFPDSQFSKSAQFKQAEEEAKLGNWDDASRNYRQFLASKAATGKEKENALWNLIYIQSHLEDQVFARLNPTREMSRELLVMLRDFVQNYPKSAKRNLALGYLSLRKGVGPKELESLTQLPSLDRRARELIQEAEIVNLARRGGMTNWTELVKKYGVRWAKTPLLKEALGTAAFQIVEPEFKRYERTKINYKPERFAASLKAKLNDLEKLDKEYFKVVAYGHGDSAFKSIERLSRLYETLALDIEKAPVDKKELEPFTAPLKQKARRFLETCVSKASELKIGGAGLGTCLTAKGELDPSASGLTFESIPAPQWTPTDTSSFREIVKTAYDAFRAGRLGEFELARSLATDKPEPALSEVESSALENMEGVLAWKFNDGGEAAKNFRNVQSSSSSLAKTAATKNLVALYLSVADYAQAAEEASSLSASESPDSALLKGLSLKASGQYAQAVSAYNEGLKQKSTDARLNYAKAIALGASGNVKDAATFMQRYIELEEPETGHVSRRLLRTWREKIQ